MALAGSYTLVKNEGVLEHLVASGVPEDIAKNALDHGKKVQISIDGDKITIKREGDPRPEQTFILNQTTEEKVFDGKIAKNKSTLKGNVLTVESSDGDRTWTRVYSLAGTELTVTMTTSKAGVPEGKRIYKKD